MRLLRGIAIIGRLIALASVLIGLPTAYAQLVVPTVPFPPVVKTISPDGVDMQTGFYGPEIKEFTIGDPNNGGFELVRSPEIAPLLPANSKAITTNWNYELKYRSNVPAATYHFTVESLATGVTFLQVTGSSSYTDLSFGASSNRKLTRYTSGSNYYFVFQEKNGKTIRFLPSSTGAGKAAQLTLANGATYDFIYDLSNKRLRRVTSNAGYQLIYEYTNSNSEIISKICAINISVISPPASPVCPAGAQSISYTYSSTPKLRITSTTNTAGATETISSTYVNSTTPYSENFRRPGEAQPWLTNNYVTDQNFHLRLHVGEQVFGDGRKVEYDFINVGTGEFLQTLLIGTGWTENSAASTSLLWGAYQASASHSPLVTPTPIQVTDPLGRSISTTYSSNWRSITNQTQPLGQKLTLSYDANGNILQEKRDEPSLNPTKALVTSYTYNCAVTLNCDKPVTRTDPRGAVVDYTYDPIHGGILSATLPPPMPGAVRPQIRYSWAQHYARYRNGSGTLVQATSPIWLVNAISECMSLASCAGTADETRTNFYYGTPGAANNLLVTQKTVAAGDASISTTTSYTYDDNGNKLTEDGPLPGNADLTRWRYDVMRRVIGVIAPDPDGAGPRAHKATRNTYDLSGRVTKIETGTVNSQSDLDWAAFAPLESVEYQYDIMSRKTRQISKAGSTVLGVTQFSYDSFGRLQCTALRMDPTVWLTQVDACVPQVTSSNGPDRITRNSYDLAGQLVQVEAGVGTAVASNEIVLSYTENGKVAMAKDGEDNLTAYNYDGHDRLVKTNYPVSTQGQSTSSLVDYEELTVDANGNVTNRRLRDGTNIRLTYDSLNRPTVKELPGVEPDVLFDYDLQSRPLSITQGSQALSFTYDSIGRNLTETSSLGTIGYNYDAAGRRSMMSYPGTVLTVSYDYDVTGNMLNIRENGAISGTGVLATYAYDNMGRKTSVTFGNGSVQSFTYDAASRIQTLTNNLNGSGITHDLTQTFSYNPVGQIASVARSNDAYEWQAHYNVDRTYVVDGLNRYVSAGGASFGYDTRGNLTSDGANSYSYTAENLLKTAPGSTKLSYDPLGRLYEMEKFPMTTRFLYDGIDLIGEYNSSDAVQRRYVHGPGIDDPIVWYEGSAISNATRRFIMADERGSVVSITDSSNVTLHINAYDEYGIPAPGNIGRFGYTGQSWLPEVGMWYYKARIYSPTLGRFLQTDPIGYDDGMNWYNYVGSDPVNATDPLGLNTNCNKGEDCTDLGLAKIVVEGKRGGGALSSSTSISTIGGPGRSTRNGVARRVSTGPQRQQAATPKKSTCDLVADQSGKVVLTLGSGSFVAGLGLSGAVGVFKNVSTGSGGFFYTAGGNLGFEATLGMSGGVYRSAADLRGVAANVDISAGVSGSASFSASGRLLGATVGQGGKLGGSVSVSNTTFFGCYYNGG